MNDLLEDLEPVVTMVAVPLTADDETTLQRLRALLKQPTYPDVLVQLLRRSAPARNGHAQYEVNCSACGLPFTSKRRPIPNRHHYCDNCRKTGEPAAQRARDYRQRKAGVNRA